MKKSSVAVLAALILVFFVFSNASAQVNIGAGGWNASSSGGPGAGGWNSGRVRVRTVNVPRRSSGYYYGRGGYPGIYGYYTSGYYSGSGYNPYDTTYGSFSSIQRENRRSRSRRYRSSSRSRDSFRVKRGPARPSIRIIEGAAIPAGDFFILKYQHNGKEVGIKIYYTDDTSIYPNPMRMEMGDRVKVRYYRKGGRYVARSVEKKG